MQEPFWATAAHVFRTFAVHTSAVHRPFSQWEAHCRSVSERCC
jgi:hypothetical protein